MPKYGLLFILLIGFSCSKEEDIPTDPSRTILPNINWLVEDETLAQGADKDAIKSVDNPIFVDPSDITFLSDEDRLLVLKKGETIKAYPINILNWHEIVNDEIEGEKITITYCPLTGTGVSWEREIENVVYDFGVSGFLHHSNLIAFDRTTDSYWSQMKLNSVRGPFIGKSLRFVQMVEMSWKSLKKFLPEAKVLSAETGFDLPYFSYPYYDYRTNDNFFYVPITLTDNRVTAKARVLGIDVLGEAIVYDNEKYPEDQVTVINQVFKGQPMVVIIAPSLGYANAFKSNLEGKTYRFMGDDQAEGINLIDQDGNEWNLFGEAVSGPNQGKKLRALKAYNGFWFAWSLFYPRIEIYE